MLWLACSPRVWYIVGLNPGRVKLKTMQLICVVFCKLLFVLFQLVIVLSALP